MKTSNSSVLNGCKCGWQGDSKHACRCTHVQIQNYRNKISGPLLDRIDIHIEVPSVRYQELASLGAGEPSTEIRKRVIAARNIQKERFKGLRKVHCNATMRAKDMSKFCSLKEGAQSLLKMAINELNFSARAYDRILKVSRTIADLEGKEQIESEHISEAIQYRTLDRQFWI